MMTAFSRRHMRRDNCSSTLTPTLGSPLTRKIMGEAVQYMTGGSKHKYRQLLLQWSPWPLSQPVGQSGHLHRLPPLWLLLQGGHVKPIIPCFELIPLPRPWYFATGGWPPWSRSCSSSSNTRSNTSFPTSQSAGEKRTIADISHSQQLSFTHTLFETRDSDHENRSKLYLRWDHWILDVLICNLGGTVIGIYTLRYFSMSWSDLWNEDHNNLLSKVTTILLHAGGCDWRLITGGVSTKFPPTGSQYTCPFHSNCDFSSFIKAFRDM